jgi:hypothetical protein
LYRSSSALTPAWLTARASGARAVSWPASGVPSACVMKLPQLALRKVSPARPLMTVCNSSIRVVPGGKGGKRDAGRPAACPTVTFVAGETGVSARFYKRLSLCTRLIASPRAAGSLQASKIGVSEPFGRVLPHGMRAALRLSDGSERRPDFCQIGLKQPNFGDRGT